MALDQADGASALEHATRRASDLDLESVIAARTDLIRLPYGDLTVVVGARAVTLNRAALAILSSLDGSRSLRAVARDLAARYGVEPDGMCDWMIPAAVEFARASLLDGVTYSPEPPTPIAAEGAGDSPRPGAPDPASCTGKRLHLSDAEFIDVHGPGGALSISCNGPEATAVLRSFLRPTLGAPARYGLGVVVEPGTSRGPLIEVFDGTGYRIWRGRSLDAVVDALAALLTPFVPDPSIRRAIFDYRRLVRDDGAVLVDARLIEDMMVQRALERMGWSIPPAVFSEIDLDRDELVVREPFDPGDRGANRVAERHRILGFGMHLQLQAGHGVAPVVEGLCNAYLPTKVTAPLVDALPAIQRLAERGPARWPLMPGTAHQLPFLTSLLDEVDRRRQPMADAGA